MGKILGNKSVIERVKAFKPGNSVVYINMDAINELPNEYDVIISEVKFKKEDFYDLNSGENRYMPKPELAYRFAEARGIYGLKQESQTEAIYEIVDISEREMSESIQMVKMVVGYKSTKQSGYLSEDGTEVTSSVCTVEYNAWNRCTEEWSKEEAKTNGYQNIFNGEYEYYGKKYNGKYYKSKNGKYINNVPLKYDTKYKRKLHFKSELKFALQKAESKAHLKTIRELACLMTGYTEKDISHGVFYFARVRRSLETLKLETAARLTSLSKENHNNILFETPKEEQEVKQIEENKKTKVSLMADIIKFYIKDQEVSKNIEDINVVDKLILWLESNPDINDENNIKFWNKAINILKNIEENIPSFMKKEHDFY